MPFRVAGAQLNMVVGDLDGNRLRILEAMAWAESHNADLLVLPELAVTGYPPGDLALRQDFLQACGQVLSQLAEQSAKTVTVVGFLDPMSAQDSLQQGGDAYSGRVANAAAVLGDGQVKGVYHKQALPNYGVFDERRWFCSGTGDTGIWEVGGFRVGVSICEDLWIEDGPWRQSSRVGVDLLVNINASPYHLGKAPQREALVSKRAQEAGVPVVYLNLVGGQDDLVFDGASVAAASDGTILHRSPQFREHRFLLDLPLAEKAPPILHPVGETATEPEEEMWEALTMATGDYFRKNGFESAVVGLSGGIDSAVTACVAADALGADRVWGVSMPSVYSSEHSRTDAKLLASNLGIRFEMVPIERVHRAFSETLAPVMAEGEWGIAGENLQARTRGTLLMAISNRYGSLVLATGNKSELSVGYATLYGDMVGGFAPLKDVYKTWVYRLAQWRNRTGAPIPEGTITKPPSAELRPEQVDTDSLPPYDELDSVLKMYIESERSADEIIASGFDAQMVRRVVEMVETTEHKRHQAPPGPRVTTKHLGRDRRRPLTSSWNRP